MRRAPATRDGKRRQPSIFGKQLTRNELVGEYANLWPILEQPFNLVYAETALFGALALRSKRLEVARSIVEDVKFATSTPVALSYVMRGIMRFVFASGMLLYLLIVFGLSFYRECLSSRFRHVGTGQSCTCCIVWLPRRRRQLAHASHRIRDNKGQIQTIPHAVWYNPANRRRHICRSDCFTAELENN